MVLLLALGLPTVAFAAVDLHLPGAELNAFWIIPFAGMLLSIAVWPLVAPTFWHHHFGKISLFWAGAFIVPCLLIYGPAITLFHVWEVLAHEYIPYVIILFTLFTVAGGVRVTGTLVGTPQVNTGILLIGTMLASWMGTTGAAMLLIRPLLRANTHRKYRVHSVIFFIFLVANIGGCLTPLGDPPLFLGFLKGISFFWPTTHLFPPMIFTAVLVLGIYFALEVHLYNKEGRPAPLVEDSGTGEKLGLDGKVNLLILLGVVGAVLMSGTLKLGSFEVYHVELQVPGLLRDVILVGLAFLSLKLTHPENHRLNDFNWFPILEVAKIFFGIFISMIPTILILQAGEKGILGGLTNLVSRDGLPLPHMYFWISGLFGTFLDNAPTYLVFYNIAGGDAVNLMGPMAETLAALSLGTVFFGAMSYIANAPNFMVRAIAENQGVAMPSFFGYMLWAIATLWPVFILNTFIFFI
ncbi:MAG: sodium:proton antiporter [Desulfovibrionaceae bacterium]|nr:sodium:proton antiporter [Desulfovibrionaceae bacterium]